MRPNQLYYSLLGNRQTSDYSYGTWSLDWGPKPVFWFDAGNRDFNVNKGSKNWGATLSATNVNQLPATTYEQYSYIYPQQNTLYTANTYAQFKDKTSNYTNNITIITFIKPVSKRFPIRYSQGTQSGIISTYKQFEQHVVTPEGSSFATASDYNAYDPDNTNPSDASFYTIQSTFSNDYIINISKPVLGASLQTSTGSIDPNAQDSKIKINTSATSLSFIVTSGTNLVIGTDSGFFPQPSSPKANIGEILFYESNLGTSDTNSIISYLKNKWSVS